jgi:thioredoxin 1
MHCPGFFSEAADIMGKPMQIGETEFDEVVLRSGNPVLIDFWGSDCKPCLAITPVIDELAEDFDGRISFIKLNVEEHPAIASRYGIMGLPTLLIFKEGRPVDSISVIKSKDELEKKLENVLSSAI